MIAPPEAANRYREWSVSSGEPTTVDRRTYIGGPDAAAIVGLSPFNSAFDVWQRKVGLLPELEDLPVVMRVGTALEQLVCDLYAERTGYVVGKCNTIIDPEQPWRGGSVDRFVYYENEPDKPIGILETKVASGWKRNDYGDENTDDIPINYLIQCAWYMSLTGLPWADLAVLFLPHTLCLFHVERNIKLEDALIQRCGDFWNKNVLTNVPPPVDGSDGADSYLANKFPLNKLDIVDGDETVEVLMNELSRYKDEQSKAEHGRKLYEQRLKEVIGDHDGVQCSRGRATWKMPKDNGGERKQSRRFYFTDYQKET
jgi:putative phage-type endonuclease